MIRCRTLTRTTACVLPVLRLSPARSLREAAARKSSSNVPLFRVVSVEHKGRGLVAQRALQPGEVILSEPPLVVHAQPGVCDHSLSERAEYKCGSCPAVFHSFEHKTSAWNEYHGLLCSFSPLPLQAPNVVEEQSAAQQIAARKFPVMVAKLLTRTFLEQTRPLRTKPDALHSGSVWNELNQLAFAEIPASAIQPDYAHFIDFLMRALGTPSAASPFFRVAPPLSKAEAASRARGAGAGAEQPDPDDPAAPPPSAHGLPFPQQLTGPQESPLPRVAVEQMLPLEMYRRAWGILHLNTLAVFGSDGDKQIGSALFRLGSLFNHSCHPNVEMQHPLQDGLGVFRTVKPVKAGEELVVTYLPPNGPSEQRKECGRLVLTPPAVHVLADT